MSSLKKVALGITSAMEFDNDRPVKRANKIEIYYWILLAFMYPLVNGVTVFFTDPKYWAVLFVANLFILPAYALYSLIIVPKLFIERKHTEFSFLTVFFIVATQFLVFALYSLVLKFSVSPVAQSYFNYSFSSLIRELLWSVTYISIAVGIYFIRKALDEKELLTTLEKDNVVFQLKYLRSQLNPHFLFNTLNSIYSLCLQNSEKASEVVVKLADLMRYLIYECNEEKVPLNKEIEFIRNYIEIEKIRYKADIRLTVEGDTDTIMIEPLLFISFIENGFKHAFDNAYSNAFIYISINVSPDQIALSVVNNTGTNVERQAKKLFGTGIANSKSMLELLYPASHALDIIQIEKEESRTSDSRIRNAKKRLESLYPDSHTLDVILSNNAFTVSLIIKSGVVDKVHHS